MRFLSYRSLKLCLFDFISTTTTFGVLSAFVSFLNCFIYDEVFTILFLPQSGVVANSELFIPDSDVMLKLLNRMMNLNLHPLTQRALSTMTGSLGSVHCANAAVPSASAGSRTSSSNGRNSIFNLLQLRAIREYGLPDQVC